MSYILGVHELTDPAGVQVAFDSYYRYLESVRERLPAGAYEFAAARWHYDPTDHRSPHDAWVESLHVTEPSSGDRDESRRVNIRLRLLGSYHDGHLEISYKDVQSYSLYAPAVGDESVGHGDWLIDEIRLSERGHVLHEIRFSIGAHWVIECLDLQCQWQPR